MPHAVSPTPRFHRFAWFLVGYNLLVILWGAWVRITGSGAGCGSHWPLCNGEVLPRAPAVETLIELSHRLTSGLDGLLVLGLFIAAWRLYPRGHRVRWAAAASLLFLIVEALVGAGLVRFDLVVDNDSVARAVVMALHLLNTFLLLASLTLTALFSGSEKPLRLAGRRAVGGWLALGVVGLILVGTSGAVTALGDTIFPSRLFTLEDLSPASHFLVRLRLLHPLLSVLAGAGLIWLAARLARSRPEARVRRRAGWLTGLLVLQLGAGLLNVLLEAPAWMQLIHLLLADLIWVVFVTLAAAALAEEVSETSRYRP
jgi:heme A synthase